MIEGRPEVVRLLARLRADINTATRDGVSPLYVAAEAGHFEAITELIRLKADPNAPSNGGVTPLYVASAAGQQQSVQALLGRPVIRGSLSEVRMVLTYDHCPKPHPKHLTVS